MENAATKLSPQKNTKILPRARILEAAGDLFYRHGIRAVGVDSIAEAADTNKMTLYRHFSSKDELVAEYLRDLAKQGERAWDARDAKHAGEPRAQLRAWLEDMAAHIANADDRGCALANAAVELPDMDHPARPVIEEIKTGQRQRLARQCDAAALADPDLLADELFLLIEGARVTAQTIGRQGLSQRLLRMGDAMIAAHDM
ncbi:MAG: TetR/AcrR family transcriptional regulator [Xanthobacteraceae bacterium]